MRTALLSVNHGFLDAATFLAIAFRSQISGW